MGAVTRWVVQYCIMVWKAPVAASPLPATPVVLGLIQRRWTDVVSRCLSVSYLVFLHWRFIFSLMRSRIGTCCPITSPGLDSVFTSCYIYMRKHVSLCLYFWLGCKTTPGAFRRKYGASTFLRCCWGVVYGTWILCSTISGRGVRGKHRHLYQKACFSLLGDVT